MKIVLEMLDIPVSETIDVSEDDMETTPFHYALEELSQYINGRVLLISNEGKVISLDLFYDFSLCYDEIVESIELIQNGFFVRNEIWFCDQGSDFYISYENMPSHVLIEFKKGKGVGLPNKKIENFHSLINGSEYVEEWRHVFSELSKAFKIWLKKEIPVPF